VKLKVGCPINTEVTRLGYMDTFFDFYRLTIGTGGAVRSEGRFLLLLSESCDRKVASKLKRSCLWNRSFGQLPTQHKCDF
jgi:hypothetical protein